MTIAKVVLRMSDLPGRFGHTPSDFRRAGAVPGAKTIFSVPAAAGNPPSPGLRQPMSGGLEGRRSCGVAVMGEARRGQTNSFARDCWGHYN